MIKLMMHVEAAKRIATVHLPGCITALVHHHTALPRCCKLENAGGVEQVVNGINSKQGRQSHIRRALALRC